MDVIKLNQSLQSEAKRLLQDVKLVEYLQTLGKISFGGSYVYGTMVDRDIDIAVTVPPEAISFDLRSQVAKHLLESKQLEGLALTDRKHFPKNGPLGIWFGPIFNFENNQWNIDIWFVTKDEPKSHHNLGLHKRMLNISEEQRKTILEIKYAALQAGTKEKGVTSALIYEAVLTKNVQSYKELTSTLKT